MAGEVRSIADELGDTEFGRSMLEIAALYERVASEIELEEIEEARSHSRRPMLHVSPYGIW
jgi:hypothetical protein